jgi:hypothetical protein
MTYTDPGSLFSGRTSVLKTPPAASFLSQTTKRNNMDAILAAMRAECIPEAECRLWSVKRRIFNAAQAERFNRISAAAKPTDRDVKEIPPGTFTFLTCLTDATMMQGGDTVMNDFPYELAKHLEFIMLARGKVLVGGLGLGCVVRGLLARGQVDTIDVIERQEEVIKLCGASVEDRRVKIHKRDAINGFIRGGPWDFAWWDLWSDPGRGEEHLQLTHMKLFKRFRDRVRQKQGAWAMPRKHRRALRETGKFI